MDPLSPIIGSDSYNQLMPAVRAAEQARQSGSLDAANQAKTQFMVIFYKEMLKQVFKTPDLSIGGESEENKSVLTTFNSDVMAEQMAQQLASNAQLSRTYLDLIREEQ